MVPKVIKGCELSILEWILFFLEFIKNLDRLINNTGSSFSGSGVMISSVSISVGT